MKKLWLVPLVSVVALGLLLIHDDAGPYARGKKKKAKAKKEEVKVEDLKPVWPSPLDPGLLDAVFKELPFGKSTAEFLTALEERFAEQLKPVLRATLDSRERDGLKAKMAKALDEVKASFLEFKGQTTGYSVSVVGEEFKQNTGEALFKYAYSDNSAYFFLSGSKLWKLVVCTEAEADFASLLVKLATTYGDPTEILHEDEEKTVPVTAGWRDTTFELRTMRPQGIFTCSRLVWTYLPMLEEVEKARAVVVKVDDNGSGGTNFLDQITGDSGEDDSDVLYKLFDKKNKEAP